MRGTKSVDLGKDRIGVLIAKLAVPAVVAQVINLLYNLVDRMYVSAIPGEEGTLAIAGLGVVFPITLIVSAFANLVGLGGAPLALIALETALAVVLSALTARCARLFPQQNIQKV